MKTLTKQEIEKRIREISSETDGVQTVHYLSRQRREQILSLISEVVEQVIKEDESIEAKNSHPIIRNELRQEQRESLKELLG